RLHNPRGRRRNPRSSRHTSSPCIRRRPLHGASGRPVLYDTLEPAAAAMLGTRERVVADSVPVTGGEPCVHAAIHRVALATRADGEDAFLRLSRAHLPAA